LNQINPTLYKGFALLFLKVDLENQPLEKVEPKVLLYFFTPFNISNADLMRYL